MMIRSVRHRGLRRFIEADDAAGLPAAYVGRIRDILSFLQSMSAEREMRDIPGWRAHQLTGNRRGIWAIHVTRNWRITFRIDPEGTGIIDLDYEDYH